LIDQGSLPAADNLPVGSPADIEIPAPHIGVVQEALHVPDVDTHLTGGTVDSVIPHVSNAVTDHADIPTATHEAVQNITAHNPVDTAHVTTTETVPTAPANTNADIVPPAPPHAPTATVEAADVIPTPDASVAQMMSWKLPQLNQWVESHGEATTSYARNLLAGTTPEQIQNHLREAAAYGSESRLPIERVPAAYNELRRELTGLGSTRNFVPRIDRLAKTADGRDTLRLLREMLGTSASKDPYAYSLYHYVDVKLNLYEHMNGTAATDHSSIGDHINHQTDGIESGAKKVAKAADSLEDAARAGEKTKDSLGGFWDKLKKTAGVDDN
jgi:hypothetical protein